MTFGGGRERERGENSTKRKITFFSGSNENQNVVQKVRKLQNKTQFGKRFQRDVSLQCGYAHMFTV